MHTHIHTLGLHKSNSTLVWAYVVSAVVVALAALLGRAVVNFRAAVVEKPDIALYLLLPEEGIGRTELLRATPTEREYLAETKDGNELIKLKKGEKQWYVFFKDRLRPEMARER